MKDYSFKKGFTLAEIMIVLSVIGVLTAVLMPVAFNAAPDENVMKFKKANSTLGTVIKELVMSNRYYDNGDLGMKAGGTLLEAKTEYYTYFCQTFAEMLSVKSIACSTAAGYSSQYVPIYPSESSTSNYKPSAAKTRLDAICANASATAVGAEIVTTDGVVWYQASPQATFGKYNTGTKRLFSPPGKVEYDDGNGFDRNYKVLCIDVDGIGVGEAPFGYGIRADGKIFTGARADLWISKAVNQGKD